MINMTAVKVRGTKIRFYRSEEGIWLVAKDVLKLFAIREKVGYFYRKKFKSDLKKFQIDDTFITVVSIQGVQKIKEDFPEKYDEELLSMVLDKIENNKILPKVKQSTKTKRKLFGIMNEAKKKTCLTSYELWSESYDLFSAYLGYEIREKAKDVGMSVIDYIEYAKLLEDFCEFVEAVFNE